jgi:hypothetical protein
MRAKSFFITVNYEGGLASNIRRLLENELHQAIDINEDGMIWARTPLEEKIKYHPYWGSGWSPIPVQKETSELIKKYWSKPHPVYDTVTFMVIIHPMWLT